MIESHQVSDYSNKWPAMFGVGMGVFMATLDVSIVNVSLPTLVKELNTDFPTIQWVILSYVLVVTALMLGVARIGDIYGKKKLYLIGLIIFTFSSFLCGMSPGVGWLIAFRALQGVGAVMTQALGAAIVTEVFPGSERGRALGIIGGIVSVGLALGPALGGILIGAIGWRSIFLVNVPMGVIATWAVVRFVPQTAKASSKQSFDLLGAVILFLTLGGYALGMTLGQRRSFSDLTVLYMLAASGGGMALFIYIEKKRRQPMLSLALFKNILFSINLIMGLLVFIVIVGTIVFPFFLQLVKGYPTEQVGLMMMTVPILMGLIAPFAGSLSDRFGPRGISLLGLFVVVGGCLSISTLHTDVGVWGYILRLAPFGIGLGLFNSPNNSAIMGAAPKEHLGVASGLMALSRTLGHVSGLPLVGVIFTWQMMIAGGLSSPPDINTVGAEALTAGVAGTFRFAAIVIGIATLLAAAAMWLDYRKQKK